MKHTNIRPVVPKDLIGAKITSVEMVPGVATMRGEEVVHFRAFRVKLGGANYRVFLSVAELDDGYAIEALTNGGDDARS